jgi:hypothetical protein
MSTDTYPLELQVLPQNLLAAVPVLIENAHPGKE